MSTEEHVDVFTLLHDLLIEHTVGGLIDRDGEVTYIKDPEILLQKMVRDLRMAGWAPEHPAAQELRELRKVLLELDPDLDVDPAPVGRRAASVLRNQAAEIDRSWQSIEGYQAMLDQIRVATGTAGEESHDEPTDLRPLHVIVAEMREQLEALSVPPLMLVNGLSVSELTELGERLKLPSAERIVRTLPVVITSHTRIEPALDLGDDATEKSED